MSGSSRIAGGTPDSRQTSSGSPPSSLISRAEPASTPLRTHAPDIDLRLRTNPRVARRVKYLARNVKRRGPPKLTITAFRDPLELGDTVPEARPDRDREPPRGFTPPALEISMSLFVPLAGMPAACLGLAARLLGIAPGTLPAADEARDRGRWLQARMLWLICGLATLFGCLYSVYFLSIGFYSGAPIGPFCVLASVAALRYARSTGRYCRAIDIIGVILFAMMALHHAVPGRDPLAGALVAGRAGDRRAHRRPGGTRRHALDPVRGPCCAALSPRAGLDRPDLAADRRPGAADGDVDEPVGGVRLAVRGARLALEQPAAPGARVRARGGAGGDRCQGPLRDPGEPRDPHPPAGNDRRDRDAAPADPPRGAARQPGRRAAAERRRADGPGQRRARLLQARRRQGRARAPAAAPLGAGPRGRGVLRSRGLRQGDRAGLDLLARRARADPRRQHADPPDRRQPRGQRDQVHAHRRRPHPPRPGRRGARRRDAGRSRHAGADPDRRLRRRHRPGAAAVPVQALPPGRREHRPPLRRHRPRPVDRQRPGAADGRPHRGDERGRPRQHLHPGDAARRRRAAARVRAPDPDRRFDAGKVAGAEPPGRGPRPGARSARRPDGGRRRGRSGQSGRRRRHARGAADPAGRRLDRPRGAGPACHPSGRRRADGRADARARRPERHPRLAQARRRAPRRRCRSWR